MTSCFKLYDNVISSRGYRFFSPLPGSGYVQLPVINILGIPVTFDFSIHLHTLAHVN